MGTFVQDLRYGARALARTPGFTAAAVLALALGIGASAAVFSVVNSVLLRPLPYMDAEQLVVILHRAKNPVAPANYLDWRRESRAFEDMGAAELWAPNLTGRAEPEKLWALRMTPSMFPVLGVPPLLGRAFLPSEGEPGSDHVIILSHRLWQRRFMGDASVIGRSVMLDGEPYTVVGVMPEDFRFAPFWATQTELWAPLALSQRAANRGGSSLRVFARLAPGVPLGQAQAEMATIADRLDKEYPGTNRDVTVLSLTEKVVGDVRPALLVLLVAVGFVLLIACANVAHLLLARAAARQRELAVRTALGASRSRIIRQLLTESSLLALTGGALGIALATTAVRVLVALSPGSIPRVETIALDGRVLAATVILSLLTGVAFGLVPALHRERRDLADALRDSSRGSTGGVERTRLRDILVASEFALALVLLVGAGLMIRSFQALQSVDPGFDPRNVLTAVVTVTGTKEEDPRRRAAFFQELVGKVAALPGVESASAINHLPLAGDMWGWPFVVEGRPLPKPGEMTTAAYRVVLPGYFRTMRIPILRGRDVTDRDRLDAPGVVVVNEEMASRQWPGEDALGKRISLDTEGRGPWLTVVGVAKNAVRGEWTAEPEEEVYLPYLQTRSYLEERSSWIAYLTLVLRTRCPKAPACDAAELVPPLREAVRSLEPNAPLSEVQTMEQVVRSETARTRFNLALLATFAAVALILAALGIYGVMSYSVSRRTHEIGIRMALGARRGDVLRLVVLQGMVVALAGAVVGLLGALALTRFMTSLLYKVGSTDVATFVAVPVVLAGVALAASYLPARRATRIDPLLALRHE
jgi:putative ABC transport system permease protein